MQHSSKPSGAGRGLSHDAAHVDLPAPANVASRNCYHHDHLPTRRETHEAYSSTFIPSSNMIMDELRQIQTYTHVINARIKYLHNLMEDERSTIAQVTAIKRELKTAHRDLEKLHFEKAEGLDGDVEDLVREAMRYAWRSYRSTVMLEEMLREGESGDSGGLQRRVDKWRIGRGRMVGVVDREAPKVYMPTGARDTKEKAQRTRNIGERAVNSGEPDREVYTASNLQTAQDGTTAGDRATSLGTSVMLRNLPRVPTRGPPSLSTSSLYSTPTDLPLFPRPREEVKTRIRQEESRPGFALYDADVVRQGSCDGFTMATMIMSGLKDYRFVMPYFHHIKHHEIRALKNWLVDAEHVTRCGVISRMEKVLHCIQLLQTGCRYETLAVVFSRSPRQVKEFCLEVMQGLLHLHNVTVDVVDDWDVYLSLWGIWRQFATTDGRAGAYYSFERKEVAQVLVALSLYIGRWRMQGKFATDGPMFMWAKFFVDGGPVQAPRTEAVVEDRDENDGDSASTIRPCTTARSET